MDTYTRVTDYKKDILGKEFDNYLLILGGPGSGSSIVLRDYIEAVDKRYPNDQIIIFSDGNAMMYMVENESFFLVRETGLNPMIINSREDISDKSDFIFWLLKYQMGREIFPLEKWAIEKEVASYYKQTDNPGFRDFCIFLDRKLEGKDHIFSEALEAPSHLAIFDNEAAIQNRNRLIFDFYKHGTGMYEILTAATVERVRTYISSKDPSKRTWIFFDELYLLTKEDFYGLAKLYKQARMRNTRIVARTVFISDLTASDVGRVVFNSSWGTFLMNMPQHDRNLMKDFCDLSDGDVQAIKDASSGNGILIC